MRKLLTLSAAAVAATLLVSVPAYAFHGGGGFHGGGFHGGGFHGGGFHGGRGFGWGAAGLGLGLAATAPYWGYGAYYPDNYGYNDGYDSGYYGNGYCQQGYNCVAPARPYGYGW
jgi:hypothetical protein